MYWHFYSYDQWIARHPKAETQVNLSVNFAHVCISKGYVNKRSASSATYLNVNLANKSWGLYLYKRDQRGKI